MRRHTAIVSAICLVFAASTARAGEEFKGIPGFLLPNGSFRPAPPPAANAPAAATTTRSGTIRVTATVLLASTAAELTPSSLKCHLTISVYDTDGVNTNQIQEEDHNPPTITGTTAKCTMSVPYLWNLFNPSSDTVNIALAITGLDANGKGRSNYLTIPPIAMPANAAVTALTIGTRL